MSDAKGKKSCSKEQTYWYASNKNGSNTVVKRHISSKYMPYDNVALDIKWIRYPQPLLNKVSNKLKLFNNCLKNYG